MVRLSHRCKIIHEGYVIDFLSRVPSGYYSTRTLHHPCLALFVSFISSNHKMSTDRKKYHQGEAYCNCTLTYFKRLVTVDTRYRHRRKMQRLSEEKALLAAASNSEEKRNIGTSFEKRDTTSLQDRTVEQSRCVKCFQCAVYRMLIMVNCRSQYKLFKVKQKETQERLDKELLR